MAKPVATAADVNALLNPAALPPLNDHPQLHEPASHDAARTALARIHAGLTATQNMELEQAVIVQCMLQVLMQKGFIRPTELEQVYSSIRDQLVEMRRHVYQGPIVIPEDLAVPALDDLDCKAHHASCEATCCTSFHIFLTPEEAASGKYVWDVRAPYKLLSDDHGTCVYFDHESKGCGIWSERPRACRSFDCRKDDRIWADYGKRVVRTEVLEARARAAAARQATTTG